MMHANRKKTFWIINDYRILNVKEVIEKNPCGHGEKKFKVFDLMHWDSNAGYWEWLGMYFAPRSLTTDLDILQWTLSNNGEERM